MANKDGEVVSFKKRELKLSPEVREVVPIPYNAPKNIPYNTPKNIPYNTQKNIPYNIPKSIPNNTPDQVIEMLKQTNSLLEDIKNSTYSKSMRRLDVYKRTNTIAIATPGQPPFDQVSDGIATQGYTREPIHEVLGRDAGRIVIRNLGPGDLYVTHSSAGTNEFTTNESYILEGDSEAILNVYEVRLRSPTAGLRYDITETEIPVATTTITRAEKIETYSTVSIVDFVAPCAINAMIIANITPPLLSNKYTIRGVNIQSVQPIDFDLIFFSSATFDTPGVLDTDTFLDSVELDMTAFPAFRINNLNQWRLAVSNLVILYEDIDVTNTLHIGLLNLGPIPKVAGAGGAVQIDFKCSPRA